MSGSAGGSRTYSLDPAAGGVSIPRLLFAFLRQRFTGTVSLGQREPAGERTIWIRGGMPVFTDWDSPRDRLGQILIEAGAIDGGGLERALAAQRSSAGLLGEILLGQKLIDEAARTNALREQCVRKLIRVFAADASTGEAVVTALEHGKGKADGLAQVNVLALLLAGVEAHYDSTRIQAEMGDALGADLVASPALARYERQFGFRADDAAVLQALGRGVTMARLMVPGTDPARALQLVYTLWVSQMLRVGDDALQAIAKGATASAAAHQLGTTIGSSLAAASSRKSAPSPKPSKPSAKAAAPAKPGPPPKPKPEAKPTPPPEPGPAEGSDDFEATLAELEAKVEAEANAFELFGLELDAGRKEVRAAWADLSKTYHPDALEGSGRSSLRPRVEKVFAALSEAYGILSNKEERKKLAEALELGGPVKAGEDTTAVVRNAFEAEMIARDADKLLRAKQWARAHELFDRAHGLSPQDSDIEAALHYSEFRAGPGDQGQALATIAALTKLVEDQPACARGHYFMGLIQLGIDDTSAAKHSFAKAAKLDPRNIDAERQLRAIRMRERGPSGSSSSGAKDDKKKGGFGGLRGLFKK
jgi:curved DNA-binding protein CbpA